MHTQRPPLRPHHLTLHASSLPVANARQVDGHTYERNAIEQWLKTHNTSPATGVELECKQLIPCHRLRSLIQDFARAGEVSLASSHLVQVQWRLLQERRRQERLLQERLLQEQARAAAEMLRADKAEAKTKAAEAMATETMATESSARATIKELEAELLATRESLDATRESLAASVSAQAATGSRFLAALGREQEARAEARGAARQERGAAGGVLRAQEGARARRAAAGREQQPARLKKPLTRAP